MAGGTEPERRVMVVADPTRESAAALQYALSHVVVENDHLILLHVENPNSWRSTFSFLRRPTPLSATSGATLSGGEVAGGESDFLFLEEMKKACKLAQPKLRVQIERAEMDGRDKAATIMLRSGVISADLLIIGQRRSISAAILGSRRGGGSMKGVRAVDTAEYLIENSKCTCVGVQKKGQNAGYLLNTKSQRNFWLLA